MEGPLMILKAWLLCQVSIYLYRRYFERVGPRVPEFEALCASEPLLAALSCAPREVAAVQSALERALGPRAQTVATLGGWPWPHYALTVSVRAVANGVRVHCRRATLLYERRPAPIALTVALEAVRQQFPNAIDDVWIEGRTVFDFRSPEPPRGGYRLRASNEPRARAERLADKPGWLALTRA